MWFCCSCIFIELLRYILKDAFIDDKFEVNTDICGTTLSRFFKSGSDLEEDEEMFFESPGIKYDETQMLSLESASNVSDSIKSYADTGYFQFYLMDLAYQQDFKHLKSADQLDFGMNNYELRDLLYTYIITRSDLLWTSNFNPIYFVSKVNYKDNQSYDYFISTIIDYIKNGIPLLTLINNTKKEDSYYGHFAIAYDYQEGYENLEDGIIFNIGLSDEHGNNVTSIPFYYIKKYIQATRIHSYFNINEEDFDHVDTNNYYDSTKNNQTSCLCELSVHPNHTHVYTFNKLDSTKHKLLCKCSLSAGTESHDFIKKTINKKKYKYCLKCGYLTSNIFGIGGN